MADPSGITSGHNPVPKKSDLNNSTALPAPCQHITGQHNPCVPCSCETFLVNAASAPAALASRVFRITISFFNIVECRS